MNTHLAWLLAGVVGFGAVLGTGVYIGTRMTTPSHPGVSHISPSVNQSTTTKRTTTRTTTPDGTVTETTKVDTKTEKESNFDVLPVDTRPKYSVGVTTETHLDDRPPGYNVEFGYRFLGSMWVTTDYSWTDHRFGAGLRVDF